MATNKLLNLVQDELQQGVVMAMEETSDILASIPVRTVKSKFYSFNKANPLATSFRDLNDSITAVEVQPEKVNVELKIAYVDVKVDRAFAQFENINVVMAESAIVGAKSLAKDLTHCFFYGNATTNAKEFDGLKTLVKDAQKITKTDPTLEDVDKLTDLVDGQMPDVIYCNAGGRRHLTKILREAHGYTLVERGGVQVPAWNGVPIVICEGIADGDYFAVRYSEEHVELLTNNGIVVTDLGISGSQHINAIEGLFAIAVRKDNAFAMITKATT